MTEENVDVPEEGVNEEGSDVFLSIYPHQQGVVLGIGEDRTLLLNLDDTWRVIGRLVSAVTIHHVGVMEEEKQLHQQQERVRRLIESGSDKADV